VANSSSTALVCALIAQQIIFSLLLPASLASSAPQATSRPVLGLFSSPSALRVSVANFSSTALVCASIARRAGTRLLSRDSPVYSALRAARQVALEMRFSRIAMPVPLAGTIFHRTRSFAISSVTGVVLVNGPRCLTQ
jgi:hypothetical protein